MNDNQGIVSECGSSWEGRGGGGSAGQHQVVLLHHSLHKRPVREGQVDLAGGDRVTSWLNYSPVNSRPSSAKIQRQSLCLICGGQSVRSRVLGEGLTVCG